MDGSRGRWAAAAVGRETAAWPAAPSGPLRRLARKGDSGTWTEERTREATPVRVTEDQRPGQDTVRVVPRAAPDGPAKDVPAREVTLDEEGS